MFIVNRDWVVESGRTANTSMEPWISTVKESCSKLMIGISVAISFNITGLGVTEYLATCKIQRQKKEKKKNTFLIEWIRILHVLNFEAIILK